MDETGQQLILAAADGMVNRGNWERIKKVMRRAEAGGKLTVGFIGGSITQDAGASCHENCYAYCVYQWWKKNFPKAEITYVNAGIGATTSHFGAARVQSDLLDAKPDFIVVEFSVNDNDIEGIDETDLFRETYEGLVRRIYGSEWEPALLLVHNVRYDDGGSAEEIHSEIGKAYELPCVSMRKSVYPLIKEGKVPIADLSQDNLHPNDQGHRILAALITSFLEKVRKEREVHEEAVLLRRVPVTGNTYENAVRIQKDSGCVCLSEGFVKDRREAGMLRDVFVNGWIAEKAGDSIVFEVEGRNIAVQYRKSVKRPAPVAEAIVDGKEEQAVILDSNFEQDWGDKLQLDRLLHHGSRGKHKVEIRIMDADARDQAPFYLAGLIVAG